MSTTAPWYVPRSRRFTRTGIETIHALTSTGHRPSPGAAGSPEQELRRQQVVDRLRREAAPPSRRFTRTGIETRRRGGMRGSAASRPSRRFTRTGIETERHPFSVEGNPATGRAAGSPEQELRRARPAEGQRRRGRGRAAGSPEQELRPRPEAPPLRARGDGRAAGSPEQELRHGEVAARRPVGVPAEPQVHQNRN